jgi:D-arabinose 1-dehydrogenase-like Zn-dependent alcohol dehydrogenase
MADWFTSRQLGWLFAEGTTAGCAKVADLIAQGTVRPAIDRQVGLDGVVAAIEAMQRGELRGQAVVVP